MEIRATSREQLAMINDLIHDRWFWVDDITYDDVASALVIKFARPPAPEADATSTWAASHGRLTEWHLVIERVNNWTLQDTEGVGRYDFNTLEYSESNRVVTINTGIPLVLHALVSNLSIRLADSGRTVENERIRR